MNKHYLVGLIAFVVLLSACTSKAPFPPNVMENISPTFEFEAWRDASPSNPGGISDSGTKIELGGRMVQSSKNGKGVVIVAEQLPIVKHPVYGPAEPDKPRPGDYEFAFLYPGEIEPMALRNGNRFVVVGKTSGRKPVMVNGIPKTEPYLVADCVHVWQTGRTEIADFKEDAGAGYASLPEKTYCVAQK
jgi:starvation-inducible outer membrane lipoprotein